MYIYCIYIIRHADGRSDIKYMELLYILFRFSFYCVTWSYYDIISIKNVHIYNIHYIHIFFYCPNFSLDWALGCLPPLVPLLVWRCCTWIESLDSFSFNLIYELYGYYVYVLLLPLSLYANICVMHIEIVERARAHHWNSHW